MGAWQYQALWWRSKQRNIIWTKCWWCFSSYSFIVTEFKVSSNCLEGNRWLPFNHGSICRKYFHKLILQSGVALHEWAIERHPEEKTRKLAKLLGCTSDDPHEILGNYLSPELKHWCDKTCFQFGLPKHFWRVTMIYRKWLHNIFERCQKTIGAEVSHCHSDLRSRSKMYTIFTLTTCSIRCKSNKY